MLWKVTNAWQRAIRAALAPLGLTHVQFVLLAALTFARGEPMTQRELADAASTDAMMASQVIRALERKGLLERRPHPTDGRAIVLIPTTAGGALVNAANIVVEEADELFFAVLGAERVPELAALLADLSRGAGQR